jgi:hypothetical protein
MNAGASLAGKDSSEASSTGSSDGFMPIQTRAGHQRVRSAREVSGLPGESEEKRMAAGVARVLAEAVTTSDEYYPMTQKKAFHRMPHHRSARRVLDERMPTGTSIFDSAVPLGHDVYAVAE